MTQSASLDFAQVIQDTKNNNLPIDWTEIFKDREHGMIVDNAIVNIYHNIAISQGIDEKQKTAIIGSLAAAKARLTFAEHFNNKNDFVTAGIDIEKTLAQFMALPGVEESIMKSFVQLEKIAHKFENEEDPTEQEARSIASALLVIELAHMLEPEDEEGADDECCDADDECCDDEDWNDEEEE